MTKKLVIINGTMGVGKTTVCRELYQKINNSVWLDGDWCWMMNPWVVSEENKAMVIRNIHFLLRSFLENNQYEWVIFSWVIHKDEIFDMVVKGLDDIKFDLHKITLVCSQEELVKRMLHDHRSSPNIEDSTRRLALYYQMNTEKIDTTNDVVDETVMKIMHLLKEKNA